MSAPSSQSEPIPAVGSEETTRQAGRGALALSFAKVFFIVLGLVQQVVLFRVMDLSGFGALRSAQSPASITYNPIVTTGILGMSQVTTRGAGTGRAFTLHAALSTTTAVVFFVLSPWLSDWLGAPHITAPLQLLAAVLFLYGLYAPLIGIFNGQRRFLHQAGLDMTAAVLRTLGLVLGAWYCTRFDVGISSVSGAVLGFVVSAVIVLLLALLLLRGTAPVTQVDAAPVTVREHLAFIGPVLVGQTVLNLLLQADVNTLRYFASAAAERAGLPLTDADPLVGAYSTAQLFAFLPYQLMVGVGFVLFPMVSKAYSQGDSGAVALYVRTGVRVAALVSGLLVSVCAGLPHALIALVFSGEAASLGGDALRLMVLGLGCLAVFSALIMVLNSLKKQWHGMAITALAFVLVVALDSELLVDHAFGSGLLARTAIGTSSALVLATLVAAFFVKREAGAVVSPLTVIRVCAVVAVCALSGSQLPAAGRLLTPLYAAAIGLLYVALLIVTRELGRSDLEGVLAIVRRRRGTT